MSKPDIDKVILRATFFVGWLLSPFTFWNDAFINIPIAYVCASIFVRIWPADFLLVVLSFYWATNILGIVLMYSSAAHLAGKGRPGRELLKLFAVTAAYSAALVLLRWSGILKPVF